MSINGNIVNQAQALDEENYQLWLRNPASAVAHLVEIDYNGTSAVYPNWARFTVKSSDSANLSFVGYPDRVKSIGSFSRQIGTRFTGVVAASIGEIEFHNMDGSLDNWHNLSFDGQKVRVFHGDPAWSRERFRLVFEAVAEVASAATWDSMKLRLRGVDYQSNLPLQTNLVGTATINGGSNTVIPRSFGEVFNVEPVVVDAVNQVFQWEDGAVTSVSDVRDGGVRFRTNQIAISAVSGNLMSTATAHGFYAGTRVRCDIGTLPVVSYFSAAAWNGSVFCIVANSALNICATSSDGFTWTQHAMPSSALGAWSDIAWNGSVFCAVGSFALNGSTPLCATSPDGVTWEAHTLPAAAGTITWNGTVFWASGAGTSPDGVTWTTIAAYGCSRVAWNGSVFCGIIYGSNQTISFNGVSFAFSSMPVSSTWYYIAWNGSVFCAITTGNNICATSPDGVTWVQHTLPYNDNWGGITWDGSVFCAVIRGSASAATSPDGATWTTITMPSAGGYATVISNGSDICAIGFVTTVVSLSTNHGITWSAISSTLPAPLALSTDYWVIPDGLTTTAFKVSATRGGTVVTLTNTTTGGALIGYHWTADLTNGKVYLDSKPAGKITLDSISGSTDAADIVVEALSAQNVDSGSKTKFQALCNQKMGMYVKDRRNRIDVANDIIVGLGAWYGYDRGGMMRFGRVEGSPTSYDFALIEADMTLNSLHIESIIKPEKQHRMQYRRNWTNQTGALFAGVSTDNRALYSQDYSVSAAQTSTDVGANGSFHALAVIPDALPSMMVLSAEALTEAQRLDTMYFGWGAIFACEVGRIGTEIDIGDVVKVTHSRYNLSGGVNMTCVYVEDNPTNDKTTLKFFVKLSAYAPGQL